MFDNPILLIAYQCILSFLFACYDKVVYIEVINKSFGVVCDYSIWISLDQLTCASMK